MYNRGCRLFVHLDTTLVDVDFEERVVVQRGSQSASDLCVAGEKSFSFRDFSILRIFPLKESISKMMNITGRLSDFACLSLCFL